MNVNIWIQILFSFIATVSFAVITNIPRAVLIPCGLVGTAGWFCYWLGVTNDLHVGVANFLGAFCIGVLSVICSRLFKMPMIIFNIPSLVPLVPGGTIYESMRYLVVQDYSSSLERLGQVLIIAGSITMAFFVVGFIERLWQFFLSSLVKKRI